MGVQINGSEGNVIATKGTYSGNVTIGGTLTYEDVTNIDSVGIITARSGIEIGASPGVGASISVDGNAIFSGITTAATLKATTGIVTSLEATTGDITTLRAPTGIVTTFVTNTAKVGAAVTITESGIEASGIGITCANINGGQISGRRNIVINGAMMVSQRGNQSATSTAGYYACDRFYTSNGSDAAVAVNRSTDSPDDFGFSYHLDCTTADTSIAAGQYFLIQYRMEGQDLQRFSKGTSSAKQFALSFYVKATKTGIYTVELEDVDNQRQISKTINVADTNWNRYVLIFPADTSGAFDNDKNNSLSINWWLLSGSTYNGGTVNTSSWASITQANRVSGSNVNAMDSTSNDFRLTGVQLEVGDQASAFEHRSFGEDFQLCQRYFQKVAYASGSGSGDGTTLSAVWARFNTPMRSAPTVTASGVLNAQGDNALNSTQSSAHAGTTNYSSTQNMFLVFVQNFSGVVQGRSYVVGLIANNSNQFFADAEL